MKTLEQCQSEIAKKHKLGTKLVTGHRRTYFNEATELYVSQFYSEDRVKLLTASAFGAGKAEDKWSEWWEQITKII